MTNGFNFEICYSRIISKMGSQQSSTQSNGNGDIIIRTSSEPNDPPTIYPPIGDPKPPQYPQPIKNT